MICEYFFLMKMTTTKAMRKLSVQKIKDTYHKSMVDGRRRNSSGSSIKFLLFFLPVWQASNPL